MNWRQYAFFMSGQLGVMLLARFFFQWILHFADQTSDEQAATVVLFSPAIVGIALLAFRIFDAVSDPLAGILSDSYVRRGKQRRALLLWWFLVPAVGLVLCFLPTHTMDTVMRWGLLLSGMLVFFLGYTFYAIPYWSLVDDYSAGESSRRAKLSNMLGLGLMLATAVGFLITPLLVAQLGFAYAALSVAIVASVLSVLPFFAQPGDVSAQRASPSEHSLSFEDVFETFKHAQFLGLCLLYVGSQMSLTIMTSAAPFIAIRLLGGSEADVALLMGPLLGAALVSFFFVPRVSEKLGWEKASLLATQLLAAVYFLGLFIGTPVLGSSIISAMVIFALAGPFIAVLLGVEAEAITACARHAGDQKVSCYFGVFNLIVKAGNGLAIFSAGILVELSRGGFGDTAIRLMLVSASVSLVLGMSIYLLLASRERRRLAVAHRATEAAE